VQSGFNYYNPYGHDGSKETRHTISIVGTTGFMGLVGYDWAPLGVDLATKDAPKMDRHVTDPRGYIWQQGAALAAECLVTGKELLVAPEHALHVLEIITAAEFQATRCGTMFGSAPAASNCFTTSPGAWFSTAHDRADLVSNVAETTPLMHVTDAAMARLLLDAGADPSLRNGYEGAPTAAAYIRSVSGHYRRCRAAADFIDRYRRQPPK
jgi:hypothetical protein